MLFCFVHGWPVPAHGQSGFSTGGSVAYKGFSGFNPELESADGSILRWVNSRRNPVFGGWMEAADASFYPLVYSSVPLWWGAAWLHDDVETDAALAHTAGWLATAGSTMLLKRVIGRNRPYVSHPDLIIRYTPAELEALGNQSSMPSGHSSMSVFAASFLAMQVDSPFARIGGGLWASSVVVSRVWNGVHYPSDVIAGTLLGAGMAFLVHQFE